MPLIVKLILLGIIQGLTEFLPVSSKGHLALGKRLLHVDVTGDRGATVEIALHAGTLIAVFVYMRMDIARLLRALVTARPNAADAAIGAPSARPLLIGLVIATLPAGIIGVCFKDSIEKWFESPRITGIGFLITAAILWWSNRVQDGTRTADQIDKKSALTVGLAQAFALIPGVSRSGTTIVAGLIRGSSPKEAARFSFLLSVPVIAGAVLLGGVDLRAVPREQLLDIFAGVFFSFVTGLAALRLLTFIAGRGRLPWFAAYLVPLGILTLLWF